MSIRGKRRMSIRGKQNGCLHLREMKAWAMILKVETGKMGKEKIMGSIQ